MQSSINLLIFFTNLAFVFGAVKITGDGTKWERCSITSSERCFKTKLHEVVVKIGNVGTDDDVTFSCCDYDNKCCTTPPLKRTFVDDWSRNGIQTWKEKHFGPCKNFVFKVQKELQCTVSKSKSGPLEVTSIDIYTKSPDKKITEPERFQCPRFNIGGNGGLNRQTQACRTGPYHFMQIQQLVVDIGPDGTDNDVLFKISSDANDFSCEVKLSTFGDDWHKNDREIWPASEFGDCAKQYIKVNDAPIFGLIKKGKDNLEVRKLTLTMKQVDNGRVFKFTCNQVLKFEGDCKDGQFCKRMLSNCTRTSIGGPASIAAASRTTTTTTKKPGKFSLSRIIGRTTKPTTTTATITTTTTTTTTKKSLLKRILG